MNDGLKLQGILKGVLDLLYPKNCIGCGSIVDSREYEYICKRCIGELSVIKPPRCLTCGAPFYGLADESRSCPRCCQLEPEFDRGYAAVQLRNLGQEIVHAFKYEGALYLLNDIGKIFQSNLRLNEIACNAAFVPVPLHPRKERARGYNQSRYLAQILAELTNGSQVEEVIKRVSDTPTQTRLNRRERQRNLKHAFALNDGVQLKRDRQYILIDDVFTTGATLNCCSAVLKRAGAQNLKVITFGHG